MNGWQTIELGQIAASVDYGVTASASQQPIGPKFLRITDIQNGSVDWEQVPWCQCDLRSATDSRLLPGDIVFARTGATTGKSFLIRECPPNTVFASYLIRVRLGSGADSKYVHQFFQTPDYWEQVTRSARGVAQPGVNASTLKVLKVPLPAIAEQRRIAAILDKVNELRAKRRAALAQFDTLTRSIFFDLFGDPATNPKGWPTSSLASLVSEGDTINYGVVQPGGDLDDGVPLIRVGDLLEGRVNHQSLKKIASAIEANYKRSRLRGNEILVSCVGSIGVIALADESVKGFNIARAVARIPLGKAVNRMFIAAYLKTDFVQHYFTNELRTVSQPTLNIKQLSETLVILPPLALQMEFDRRVAAVEKLKAAHRASLAEVEALFASLQHRAFRGEL